jgi:serine/threonine-protein kinase
MGTCVLVKLRHARIRRRFVLKYLSPRASKEPYAVEAFLQASHAAMRLRSEHAARIVDVGRLASGLPYLIVEAFQGSELRDVIRIRGAFRQAEAVELALQAAQAVAEAHRQGIVHGSLCPSTLLVTPGADGLPAVKVLDFGTTGSLRPDPFAIQLRNWTHGTHASWESLRIWDALAFTAPEQLRDSAEPTPAVDVWALGAVLYELLTGCPPFRAPTATALMAAIVADSPPPLCAVRGELGHELNAVVLRCLSKAPEARFATVSHLAAALRPFASPSARLLVDRIARIQKYDPDQARWSNSSHTPEAPRRRQTAMNPAFSTRRSGTSRRSVAFKWVGSVLLTMLAALGGVLAGTLVARSLASDHATDGNLTAKSLGSAVSASPNRAAPLASGATDPAARFEH